MLCGEGPVEEVGPTTVPAAVVAGAVPLAYTVSVEKALGEPFTALVLFAYTVTVVFRPFGEAKAGVLATTSEVGVIFPVTAVVVAVTVVVVVDTFAVEDDVPVDMVRVCGTVTFVYTVEVDTLTGPN